MVAGFAVGLSCASAVAAATMAGSGSAAGSATTRTAQEIFGQAPELAPEWRWGREAIRFEDMFRRPR